MLRLLILLAAILFVGSALWSFWSESLQPIIKQGDYLAAGLEAGGFVVIWLGVGLIAYSAFLVLRNTYRLFTQDAVFQHNVAIVRQRQQHTPEAVREARRSNLRALWQAWRPALPWMLGGWIVLAVGGFLVRLAERSLSYL